MMKKLVSLASGLLLCILTAISLQSQINFPKSQINDLPSEQSTDGNFDLLPITHFGEGVCYAVAQNQDYVFYGNGSVLEIVDIGNPANPEIIGRYHSPSVIRGIMVSDDRVYLADFLFGLRIIDFSDPTDPTEIGGYNTPGYAMDVTINNNKTHALVADGPEGIRVINIEDPASMYETGTLPTNGWALSVDDTGDNVLVACDTDGVLYVSYSDPSNPMVIHHIQTSGQAWDAKSQGLYIYVAERGMGFHIYDGISYEELGAVSGFGSANQIALAGSAHHYAYVANHNYGLWIINIFDPANPQAVTYLETPQARAISINERYVGIGDYYSGLHLFNVNDPENPVKESVVPCWGLLNNIRYRDKKIYTDAYQNMALFNATNLSQPMLINGWGGSTGVYDFEISNEFAGDRAYVANLDEGLWIADITDPGHIFSLGSWIPDPNRAFGVALDLDPYQMVFLATGTSVQALDVSDPNNIELSDEIYLSGLIQDVTVNPENPSFFYVAGQGQGFSACYMHSNGELEEMAHIDSEAQVINLTIQGDYLYAADCGTGVRIFDIQMPGSPVEVASVNTGDCAYDVSVAGNYLYVANSYSGITVFDITDPENPQYVYHYQTGGYAVDVEAFNDTIFVADGEDGFYILKQIEVEDSDQDGIADYLEQGPNGNDPQFDGDGDGIPDWQQSSAASLHSHDGLYYVTISTGNNDIPLVEVSASAVPNQIPDGFEFPFGIFKYKLNTEIGATGMVVRLTFHSGPTPDSYFNFLLSGKEQEADWYEFLYDGNTGAEIIDNVVDLHYNDGGRGDLDGLANGVISAYGGPAKKLPGFSENKANPYELNVFPNPSTDVFMFEFYMDKTENVELYISGENANLIFQNSCKRSKGKNQIIWHPGNLANGIYQYKLIIGKYETTGKIGLTR